MSRRGDNIHKRKDGRWEGRYIITYNENNKAIYSSVYGKTYSEVKSKLDYAKFQAEQSQAIKPLRFSDIIDSWLVENKIKIKPATYTKYKSIIETHIKSNLGNILSTQITSEKINSFLLNKLQNGKLDGSGSLSPTYVRSIALIINSVVNYAVNEGYIEPFKNPIYKPSTCSKSPNTLSNNDYVILSNYLKNDVDYTKLAIMLALYSGLRIGEICALKWDNIDFEKSIIHISSTVSRVKDDNGTKLIIETPKTKSSDRFIPIPNSLLQILEQFYNNKNPFVISNSTDFVNPRTLEYRFHKVLKEANVQQTNFHSLRHTFATKCIEIGMDVKSLSEILGHANSAITLNVYVHSSMELKRSQIEKLIA